MSGRSDGGPSGHVDEGTVHAWLDGQLSGDEAARIEAHVAACPACSAVVAEARGHIAASTRILTALDGVPAHVVPRRSRRPQLWQLRVAAAIVVMALGTAVVLRRPGGPLGLAERANTVDHAAAPAAKATPGDAGGAAAQQVPPRPNLQADLRAEPNAANAPAVGGRPAPRQAAPPPSAAPLAAVEGQPQSMAESRALGMTRRSASSADSVARENRPAAPAPVPSRMQRPALDSIRSADAGVAHEAAPMAKSFVTVADTVVARDTTRVGGGVPDSGRQHIIGHVVDAMERAPIPAAAVVVTGTRIGQSTSDSGTFQLDVPTDAKSITVRRIGYLALSVPLTPGTTDYTIPLQKDELRLEAEVVTGVATRARSQNAAKAGVAGAPPSVNGGAPGGGLALTLTAAASTCRNRTVRVATTPSSDSTTSDSASIRLTGAASVDSTQPGFVFQVVGDASALSGTWQTLGRDSAIVEVHGPSGVVENRVRCR